ncbi:gamma-glutamyl-gamma-aminobutyrate hydrolase family protein [Lentilactobacillus raoultii]|uniref:Gamma-glutamyl-gamma-aminobutyrate hydrolase family protein n=1 Tax=Lentilactobacillus raoultii TaxID=1987503 RepID=A0ABW3PUW4_9LACO|nr:gamma-glutamyl-gamma-aminobutyrate hydrolase family protein [Lentilactobacillus raoultii]
MQKQPIIGVPAESRLLAGAFRNSVNEPEINGIADYGGVPLMIPTRHPELMPYYLPLIDGLLLPGGPDVSPVLYGEEPIPGIGPTDTLLDQSEIQLVKLAVAQHIPIFGLCRGLQIINVALGGTLYQDLTTQKPKGLLKHHQDAPMSQGTHHVSIVAGSKLSKIFGVTSLLANSHHHESVKQLASGLKLSATASDDVVEGAESLDDDSIIAVQWHPETMYQADEVMARLFADLIERAKNFSNKK